MRRNILDQKDRLSVVVIDGAIQGFLEKSHIKLTKASKDTHQPFQLHSGGERHGSVSAETSSCAMQTQVAVAVGRAAGAVVQTVW